jgi:hypothetical protein
LEPYQSRLGRKRGRELQSRPKALLGIGGWLVFGFCFEIGDAIEKNVLDE